MAIRTAERLAQDPDRAEAQRDLAEMYEAQGIFYQTSGEPEKAQAALQAARQAAQASATRDPHNLQVEECLNRIMRELLQ